MAQHLASVLSHTPFQIDTILQALEEISCGCCFQWASNSLGHTGFCFSTKAVQKHASWVGLLQNHMQIGSAQIVSAIVAFGPVEGVWGLEANLSHREG